MWLVHVPCGRSLWSLKKESGTVLYYERPSFEAKNPPIAVCPGCGHRLSDAARSGVLVQLIETRDLPEYRS